VTQPSLLKSKLKAKVYSLTVISSSKFGKIVHFNWSRVCFCYSFGLYTLAWWCSWWQFQWSW